MIHYMVTAGGQRTMQRFVVQWETALAPRVKWHGYEQWLGVCDAQPGAYIFSDLEALSSAQLKLAQELYRRLREAGPGFVALNDPSRVLRRYDLTRRLHECGINPFRSYRLDEDRSEMRFPVFVRCEHTHAGSLSPLLNSHAELNAFLRKLTWTVRPQRRRGLLLTEFVDTADDQGIYRKYSVMRIGSALIPKHVIFSRKWMVKLAELDDEAKSAEEARFVMDLPREHHEQVWRAFEEAGIEYGRIDYAMAGDRVVVWEINTNPTLMADRRNMTQGRIERLMIASAAQATALRSLDEGLPAAGAVRVLGWRDLRLTIASRLSASWRWRSRLKKPLPPAKKAKSQST
jgi:hypothetical protein